VALSWVSVSHFNAASSQERFGFSPSLFTRQASDFSWTWNSGALHFPSVLAVHLMRLPPGVVKSIRHMLPLLKSDIDTPFSKSLATLAEEKHKTIANSQQGHHLKIPSIYLSWHRALSQP